MPSAETLDARTARRRTRWRRLNRALSGGVGALAVASGIYLGVTAPTSSPVVGAAPAPATSTTPPSGTTTGGATTGGATAGGTTTGGGVTAGGPGVAEPDGGGRRGGDRGADTARSDGHHR